MNGDRRATRLYAQRARRSELGMLCRALGRAGLSDRTFRRLRAVHGRQPAARPRAARRADRRSAERPRRAGARAQVAGGSDPAPAGRALGGRARLGGGRGGARGAQHARRCGRGGGHGGSGRGARRGRAGGNPARAGDAVGLAGVLRRICLSARRSTATSGRSGGERSICVPPRSWGARKSLAHRTAAAAGADPELAADLDEAAGQAAAAGKLRLAARYLQQAADGDAGRA